MRSSLKLFTRHISWLLPNITKILNQLLSSTYSMQLSGGEYKEAGWFWGWSHAIWLCALVANPQVGHSQNRSPLSAPSGYLWWHLQRDLYRNQLCQPETPTHQENLLDLFLQHIPLPDLTPPSTRQIAYVSWQIWKAVWRSVTKGFKFKAVTL